MPRSYTHLKAIEKEIFEMREKGKANYEIADYFDISSRQIENLVNRHNRARERLEAGILPRRRGRPPKGHKPTEQEKDNEIKRLKMENELLRDFLRHAGGR